MKKLIISGITLLSLVAGAALSAVVVPLGGTIAFAQTYSSYGSSYGSCGPVSGYLSMGSRGSQVSALQQFLASQNYPGSGSWMVTGYYGSATAAAVRDFQRSRGLPQTGVVDSATLSALQNCNLSPGQTVGTSNSYSYPGYPGYTGTTYPYGINYPYSLSTGQAGYSYPTANGYPYNYSYPYNYYNNYYNNGTPAITSLSQNTGTPGQTITIYGQGFSPYGNTVYFDGESLPGNVVSSGTSLAFTIPYISAYSSNQTVQMYVANAGGTSNSVSFTLNPSLSCNGYACGNCGTYPYSYGYSNCNCGYSYNYGNCSCANTYAYTSNCNSCGYSYNSYPYNYGCQGNVNSPTITYLSPNSGGIGTNVTVYGSGFTTNNNTVHFGNGIITGLQSPDGQSVSFAVPSQLTGYGSQPVVLGTYNVSVTNSNNVSTNAISFVVTSTNGSGNGAPTITGVSGPNSLSTGAQGTWTMTINPQGNANTTVSAYWGDTNGGYVNQAAPQTVTGAQVVSFTHAYSNPGTYTLTFTVSNSNGSNSYTSTVYVSGNGYGYGTPTLNYVSPSSGYVGAQITIYGSNFSTSGNNVVYFGSGAIQNVYSNGNSITFTVPSYTTPYCTPGLYCGVQATQVTPGTYNISMMDQYGTSNQVSFTVL